MTKYIRNVIYGRTHDLITFSLMKILSTVWLNSILFTADRANVIKKKMSIKKQLFRCCDPLSCVKCRIIILTIKNIFRVFKELRKLLRTVSSTSGPEKNPSKHSVIFSSWDNDLSPCTYAHKHTERERERARDRDRKKMILRII